MDVDRQGTASSGDRPAPSPPAGTQKVPFPADEPCGNAVPFLVCGPPGIDALVWTPRADRGRAAGNLVPRLAGMVPIAFLGRIGGRNVFIEPTRQSPAGYGPEESRQPTASFAAPGDARGCLAPGGRRPNASGGSTGD